MLERAFQSVRRFSTIALLAAIGGAIFSSGAAAAGWDFSKEIPCSESSVSGIATGKCWISQERRDFRSGFAAVTAGTVASWVQNADALQEVVSGGANWQAAGQVGSDVFVSFAKKDRQCIAFVRNGPLVAGSAVGWILAGAFCRASATPLQPDELKFFLQGVQIKS